MIWLRLCRSASFVIFVHCDVLKVVIPGGDELPLIRGGWAIRRLNDGYGG